MNNSADDVGYSPPSRPTRSTDLTRCQRNAPTSLKPLVGADAFPRPVAPHPFGNGQQHMTYKLRASQMNVAPPPTGKSLNAHSLIKGGR